VGSTDPVLDSVVGHGESLDPTEKPWEDISMGGFPISNHGIASGISLESAMKTIINYGIFKPKKKPLLYENP